MAIAGLTPADVRANVSGVGSLSDERLDIITEAAAALIERYAGGAPVSGQMRGWHALYWVPGRDKKYGRTAPGGYKRQAGNRKHH